MQQVGNENECKSLCDSKFGCKAYEFDITSEQCNIWFSEVLGDGKSIDSVCNINKSNYPLFLIYIGV